MQQDDLEKIKAYRDATNFGGWFSNGSAQSPSKWKEALLILLMLFPIVMLEYIFLSPFIGGINLSLRTFIGNSISVALLTWPLMPFITYCFKWWLVAKSNLKIDLLGTLIIIILYILEVLAFWIYA